MLSPEAHVSRCADGLPKVRCGNAGRLDCGSGSTQSRQHLSRLTAREMECSDAGQQRCMNSAEIGHVGFVSHATKYGSRHPLFRLTPRDNMAAQSELDG
jgi:hypothetical protein